MGFYTEYLEYKDLDVRRYTESATEADVLRALERENLSDLDLLTLLSPAAESSLELMAQKAHQLTLNQFGRSILLYTPMYLSNYCVNHCVYCGFNTTNSIRRSQLTFDEVEREAAEIASTGLKHILILTGEAKSKADVAYLSQCCEILSRYFTSIGIEVYPMDTDEYKTLVDSGVDGLTVYQETYNEELYDRLHPKGPKKDYMYRLDAPERGCMAAMRSVGIGALLGLDDWRREAFITGLHGRYLIRKYPEVDISVSLPRMRPHAGAYEPDYPVNDRNLVQILTAFRLFMPRAGITISTRESARFRDNILPLGVTKMSAGSNTSVGGHSKEENDTGQFDINDERTVEEMADALTRKGFQPVYKDWQSF